jgi:predicted anti-sigma-YlaC factor YlaD
MNTNHLSAWEQEEYILQPDANQQALYHLQECSQCRDAVARLENGVAVFRSAAVNWSSECLAVRPQQLRFVPERRAHTLRWAFVAMIPLVLLLLALLPLHLSAPRPAQTATAQISDDALLDQVDEQVSAAVPSSMESLTHLVSSGSNASAAGSDGGSRHLVQTN